VREWVGEGNVMPAYRLAQAYPSCRRERPPLSGLRGAGRPKNRSISGTGLPGSIFANRSACKRSTHWKKRFTFYLRLPVSRWR